MTETNGLHDHRLVEQEWNNPAPPRNDDATLPSDENAEGDSLIGAPIGLFALIEEEWAAAFWAIEDLAERARALDIRLPLTCEDAGWVALIRSVNHPTAGDVGAKLKDRIGSELAWEEGRQRWKRKIKEIRRSLAEERKDFESFESLYMRLHRERRSLLTKDEYHEKAIEDWLWDLDYSQASTPTAEEFTRLKNRARESGEMWLVDIRAREHALHMMELDYDADGKDLFFYRHLNLSLADRGASKITRAEFWAMRGRRFDPTRLSIYRALLGDLALPAASPG